MMSFSIGRLSKKETSISALEADDCEQLVRIHEQTFHHAWNADEFRSLLTQNTVFGFVARPQGKPNDLSGFVLARLVAGEAEILTIAVSIDIQRQGVGRALMDAVLRHLYRERAESLFLEVDEANTAAQALYKRIGFLKVGERPAYYETAKGRSSAHVLKREFKYPVKFGA